MIQSKHGKHFAPHQHSAHCGENTMQEAAITLIWTDFMHCLALLYVHKIYFKSDLLCEDGQYWSIVLNKLFCCSAAQCRRSQSEEETDRSQWLCYREKTPTDW